jgi:hypothetical protein
MKGFKELRISIISDTGLSIGINSDTGLRIGKSSDLGLRLEMRYLNYQQLGLR